DVRVRKARTATANSSSAACRILIFRKKLRSVVASLQPQPRFYLQLGRARGCHRRVQLREPNIARFWTAARVGLTRPSCPDSRFRTAPLSKADTAPKRRARAWLETRVGELLTDLLTVDGHRPRPNLLYSLLHPNVDDSLSSPSIPTANRSWRRAGAPDQLARLTAMEQPSLKAGFLYEAKSETLYISVEYLTNLSSTAQLSGGSLYLKLYLLPGPDRRSKQKIRFCQDELSGRRNHFLVTENVVTYSLNRRELSHKQLSIAVWINPAIHSARELHRLCVPLSKYLDECVHYELLKFPAGSA
uniref:C2 PI3K-type domain-containing protein n=1 Tax=Macrostomum lignano TaxID=282301 RepID=A0A1I8FSR8_9PLAT